MGTCGMARAAAAAGSPPLGMFSVRLACALRPDVCRSGLVCGACVWRPDSTGLSVASVTVHEDMWSDFRLRNYVSHTSHSHILGTRARFWPLARGLAAHVGRGRKRMAPFMRWAAPPSGHGRGVGRRWTLLDLLQAEFEDEHEDDQHGEHARCDEAHAPPRAAL